MDALGKGLSPGARQALVVWLGGCAGWVFSMVVLGGMTRLTRSGLSMTDWKFTGERAPRSQVEVLSLIVTSCRDGIFCQVCSLCLWTTFPRIWSTGGCYPCMSKHPWIG